MADFDFPDDLLAAEREAWAAHQAGQMTVAQANTVQDGITAYAEASGVSRVTVEMALKKAVRHTEAAAG